MKGKLLKLLQAKEARKSQLAEQGKATADIAELRRINAELDGLNGELAELRGLLDAIPAETELKPEQRLAGPLGPTQLLATYGLETRAEARPEAADPYGSLEYRTAFMKFAKTGQLSPELRAATLTTAAEVSAVIPSTILAEVIRKVEVYGQVYARVRKLNIRGGVNVPILSLKPTAVWVGETPPSAKQEVRANTNVSFSYHGLECKVAVSLLADTVSLPAFEGTITDLIVEAMVKALDAAIISGDGVGKALGLTVDTRVPASHHVTISAADFRTWAGWKRQVFAQLPLAYKAGAVFLMASGTFEGYIDGMVDGQGQPIGRVNYGIAESPQERFGGKPVIQVEDDIIAPYDDAATGEVVAVYGNLRNYAINSNLQMSMFRYLDHDVNEWVNKAILIMDGKLLDANSVVVIKKGL